MTRHLKDLEGPRNLWFGLENCLFFFEIVPSQKQTFLFVSGRYIDVPQRNNNIMLCKFGEKIVSVFLITGNITKAWVLANGCLNIFIFFHFPDSGLSLLHRIDFHFWWSDSDNRFKGIGRWIRWSNQINFFV